MKIAIRIITPILLSFMCLQISAQEFQEERIVTTSEQPLQFANNTRGSIGIDSFGRIHVVYNMTDESSAPAENLIWYQWIDQNQISEPIRVDNGGKVGGKHASLAIDENNTVHVVWHDYRHSTAAGNYIDNIEIYYDKKEWNGAFSKDDIRLTTTNADHQGDNGYAPQICVDEDNRLHIVWYDFNRNGNNGEIYLMSTDENGNFPLPNDIEAFRITSVEQNPATFTSNWLPDLAPLPGEDIYAAWGFLQGWQGSFEIQGQSIDSQGNLSSKEIIASKGGRFIDPARLTSDSEGNLALVLSEYVDGMYRINLYYKAYQNTWAGPFIINDGNLDATQPCAAFVSPDELMVVWQEDLGGLYQVVMATVNPKTQELIERKVLSSNEQDARTPSLAVRSDGKIAVTWINHHLDGESSIVLRTTEETLVEEWWIY